MTGIHEHIAERMELAGMYASDGAFHTAPKILETLAIEVRRHAEECDEALRQMMGPR